MNLKLTKNKAFTNRSCKSRL